MATDNILRTYGDVSRVEDVMPLVEILTAKETWFLQNLQKTKAIDTVHSTLTDTLITAASLAVEEAADYTYGALTTPLRVTNLVENIVRPIKVSRTQMLVQHYHGQNEKARQMAKAMADWGNAAEFDILRSTLVSGASGTVAKMSGILEAISKSTNTTTHASATVFSASILKGLAKANWENSNGDIATDIFLDSNLKGVLDSFTAGATKFVMSKEAQVWDYVDVYDAGGFGRYAIHMHRYLYQSGDGSRKVLGIRKEKLAIAMLEPVHVQQDLAITGDYEPAAVVGKLTLEVRNKDSNFLALGFAL